MLSFALRYRKPIDNITADKEYKLRKYELEEADWAIVEELVSVLKQFKQATLYFSKDTASVAAVIPVMDRLTNGLNATTKKKYSHAILAALKLASNKLNRYYSLTDDSITYRIAMVLHPGMKLEYFRQNEWQQDWIDQAETLVRQEYETSYEDRVAPRKGQEHVPKSSDDFVDFGNLSVAPAARSHEIDDYLRMPVESVTDPL